MEGLQERLGMLAIIGGGKMGEAIVAGLVQGAGFNPAGVQVAEPFTDRCELITELYGVRCVADGAMIDAPETVIIAVKPQIIREVLAALAAAEGFQPRRVVSIAAGVTSDLVRSYFPDCAVIRVMPNLALSVSAGMSVVAAAEGTSPSEAELVCELFSLMGEALILDEGLIDVATAVSGSGPAYFALFAEELAKSGIAAGLPEETARQLARQTVIGAGRYLDLTGSTPEELREAVTSPNGTTQAALESFADQGFADMVQNAFDACIQRAKELA